MSTPPFLPAAASAPYTETYALPFDYPGYLTSQYQGATRLQAWLAAPLGLLDDIVSCLAQFPAGFDLASATGAQLNTLGVILGQSRTVGFQPSNGVSPVLDDATYRLLLTARIAQNQWDGTIDGLQAIWKQLFPGGAITIEDGQNMTATVLLSGVFPTIVQDLITHGLIVPRPQAVLYNFVFSQLPIFGTDQSNAYIAGVDLGHIS